MKDSLVKRLGNDKRGLSATAWLQTGLGIAFGIILMGVLAIILGALKTTTYTDPTNLSTGNNATTILANGQTFLVNLTAQLGTVGTVAGVLLLLGLVVASGIGGYMMYQKSKS